MNFLDLTQTQKIELYEYSEIEDYFLQLLENYDIKKLEVAQAHAILMKLSRRFFLGGDYWKQGNKDKYYIYNIDLVNSSYYVDIFKELLLLTNIIPSLHLYSSFVGIRYNTLIEWIYKLNTSRTNNLKLLNVERREIATDKTINSGQIVGVLHYLNNTTTQTGQLEAVKIQALEELKNNQTKLLE